MDDLVGDVLREVPELELELEAVAAVARVDLLLEDLLVHVQPVLLVVPVYEVQAEVPVLQTRFDYFDSMECKSVAILSCICSTGNTPV